MVAVHIDAVPHSGGAVGRQGFPIRFTGQIPPADADMQMRGGVFLPGRLLMLGEGGVEYMGRGAGGLREIRDLRRGQAEIGRHPDRADGPAGPHRLDHGVGIARVHQHAVALVHAARGQRPGGGMNPGGKLRPGPGGIPPDQRRAAGEAPRGLLQQMREVARGYQRPLLQRRGSRIDT